MKFKVGDEVTLSKESQFFGDDNQIKGIGTVTSVYEDQVAEDDLPYSVEWSEEDGTVSSNVYHARDLEPYTLGDHIHTAGIIQEETSSVESPTSSENNTPLRATLENIDTDALKQLREGFESYNGAIVSVEDNTSENASQETSRGKLDALKQLQSLCKEYSLTFDITVERVLVWDNDEIEYTIETTEDLYNIVQLKKEINKFRRGI